MEITPEMQAQIDEQKKSCIFCQIIKGETESKKVYEDDKILAVLDINPAVAGHTLLMPKEHYPIMPYIQAKEWEYFFGMMPQIVSAIQRAMVSTSVNIFVAGGGAAGQQSQHFMVHVIPRDENDGLSCFELPEGVRDEKTYEMLKKNLGIMLQNHMTRNPATWQQESFQKGNELYEDQKVIVRVPQKPSCKGHLIVEPRNDKTYSEFDDVDSTHIWYVASFAASAVFEGLGAHGTNIIFKSGKTIDNPDGNFCVHVIPRWSEDGLDFKWANADPKPDMDEVMNRIKSETLLVQLKKKETVVISNGEIADAIDRIRLQ